ncbi:MAG: PAS domain-containing sensor histidine kinase, partial [Gemmatimonadaceae bacterium]|nr:PAS domain-containing sensor histidine kinase [Gemmatimonadaceae bacterium]
IISIDEEQRILLFNSGAEEIFGYTAAEVMGQALDLLIPPRYRQRHEAEHLPSFARAHGTSRKMGERREVYGLRRNGEEFPAEISISKVDVDGRRMYTAVIRDATERKRYEAALTERGDVAQRATRARDEILGVVAHDLRNPLATIKMCTSALSSGAVASGMPERASERVTELTGVIQEAVTWMEHIIRDLLDVTALEAGRLSMTAAPLPVEDILDAVEGMYTPIAADAKVAFSVAADLAPPPPVMADPERLLQAIGNLTGNAIKFTPAGGSVGVRASVIRRAGAPQSMEGGAGEGAGDRAGPAADAGAPGAEREFVRFEIRDTGPGIPADQLPHIFDRFWQVRQTIRAGAGLGLAIAKGIADAHGGSLHVESEVGVGTRFWMDIPTAD